MYDNHIRFRVHSTFGLNNFINESIKKKFISLVQHHHDYHLLLFLFCFVCLLLFITA